MGRCQIQVQNLADEAGPLIEALPKALKQAVKYDKVPKDLREDVVWLASIIEPYVGKLKKIVEKDLPEQTEKILDKADDYVDKASEVHFILLSPCLTASFRSQLSLVKDRTILRCPTLLWGLTVAISFQLVSCDVDY